MRPAALTILAVLALAPGAHGFYEAMSLPRDLDGDGTNETLRTARVQADPSQPPDDELDGTRVEVVDDCAGGQRATPISGVEESLGFMRAVQADTRPGLEAFIDLRSGASGRAGETRVVAWRLGTDGCRARRNLFLYRSERPTRRPRGTLEAVGFGLVIRELERRHRGRELVLQEGFARNGDSFCCPSVVKRSYFRYDRVRDRYVRYATRVMTLRRPGGADVETEPEPDG